MPSVSDIEITIIDEEPGPTITQTPVAAIDVTVDSLLTPAVVEIEAEMQMELTIPGAMEPEVVEVVRPSDVATITVPEVGQPEVIQVEIPGIQGAKGVQNVWVQETPPANPEVNWIWIDPTT